MFKNIDEVLEQSPDIPSLGKTAFYSVHCCWWTSYPEDLGNTAKFMPGKLHIKTPGSDKETEVDFNGLPCCPHCGSVLMQAPLDKFISSAQETPHYYGEFGIKAFLEAHSRISNRCDNGKGWTEYNRRLWLKEEKKRPGSGRFA